MIIGVNSKIIKIISVLLSVFIILYVVTQAVSFFYSPYETETVFETTINNSIHTSGLVIRNEKVIDQKKQGVLSYQIPNGSKVSKNSVIAMRYATEQDMLTQAKIESITKEINVLTEAQRKGATVGATLDSITTQLNETYLQLMGDLNNRALDELEDYKLNIQELISKKHIVIGKQADYNAKIASLRAEQKELQSSIQSKPNSVTADHSGYFAQTVDGYEEQFRCEDAGSVSIDTLNQLITQKKEVDANKGEDTYIGKIIDSFEWKMVARVNKTDITSIKAGTSVRLIFHAYGDTEYEATVDSVDFDKDREQNTVVFSCNIMDNNITRMRIEDVEIAKSSVTGIKVPKKAVRYENDEIGVYEKIRQKLYFRKIDKLYETEDYIISKIHEDDSNHEYVHQYDDVVIKGKDLYDQKPVG
ncbi:MAG: HlyD family efflux transporter periplasmic adaptor subunit [Clostridiales bacterium]|nr:HlyD family efflux transporter periplasmic adaptor subunit [Clostridiales bacterium]